MLKRLARSFLDLVYPPLCLHCGQSVSINEPLFCSSCLDELTLIDPANRCPFCFHEHEMAKLSACLKCRHKRPILDGLAAACEAIGPAKTLLHQLRSGGRPSLAKGAGALMASQFLNIKWPFPDLIVPVPIAWTHLLERGYNQSLLLAESVGTILQRPVVDALKRKSGDFSQALLARSQREKMNGDCFSLKDVWIEGKTILLIDDMLSTGTTLRHCAARLMEEEPKAIYGLVFCQDL